MGGDFYDCQDFRDGRIALCIGDVSGKGVPAALYMAKAIHDFRREAGKNTLPGAVCGIFNDLLAHSGASGMFLTFFYGIVDPAHGKFIFCNAGHEPMIVYRKAGDKAEIFKSVQGTPLGLFEGTHYETAEISFGPGDAFLLLSDGVKELRDPRGKEFGAEKLRALFESEARAYDRPSKRGGQELKRKVRTLVGNYQVFSHLSHLMNPIYSPIAWQLFSHKFLRLLAPFFLGSLLLANMFLVRSAFYQVFFLCQILFYGMALFEAWSQNLRRGKRGIGYLPYTFCLLNYSAFLAFVRFLSRRQKGTWEKAYA